MESTPNKDEAAEARRKARERALAEDESLRSYTGRKPKTAVRKRPRHEPRS